MDNDIKDTGSLQNDHPHLTLKPVKQELLGSFNIVEILYGCENGNGSCAECGNIRDYRLERGPLVALLEPSLGDHRSVICKFRRRAC